MVVALPFPPEERAALGVLKDSVRADPERPEVNQVAVESRQSLREGMLVEEPLYALPLWGLPRHAEPEAGRFGLPLGSPCDHDDGGGGCGGCVEGEDVVLDHGGGGLYCVPEAAGSVRCFIAPATY